MQVIQPVLYRSLEKIVTPYRWFTTFSSSEHACSCSIQNTAFTQLLLLFRQCKKTVHYKLHSGSGGHDLKEKRVLVCVEWSQDCIPMRGPRQVFSTTGLANQIPDGMSLYDTKVHYGFGS
jgi:hypothetical protein